MKRATDRNQQYALCQNITWKIVNNKAIVLKRDQGVSFSLNSTGTEVFLGIVNGEPLSDLVSRMQERYKENAAELKKDITGLLRDFVKNKILARSTVSGVPRSPLSLGNAAPAWWAHPGFKWLDEAGAVSANLLRDELVKDILPEVNQTFFGKKLHIGPLSPGCAQCVQGTWTCAFFSSVCNATCFFCPSRALKVDKSRFLVADRLTFNKEESFLSYIKTMNLTGVSFSGGECLLHFDELLNVLHNVRERFGKKIHLWIYSNGYLVNEARLKKLRKVGLDEIRINIAADQYSMRAIRLAARFIPTVTVESPMIPADYEIMLSCLPKLKREGCGYVNLHQIYSTEFNHKGLAEHGYTLLRGAGLTPPTLEPELAVLKLMRAALDENIGLPINYCTWEYRCQVTGWSRRRRAAELEKETYDDITPAGYLRRISICDSPQAIKRIAGSLQKQAGRTRGLWAVDRLSSRELHIHPDLLNVPELQNKFFAVRYFDCEVQLDSTSVSSERTVARAACGLSAPAVRRIINADYEGLKVSQEGDAVMLAREYERIREGFPKLC